MIKQEPVPADKLNLSESFIKRSDEVVSHYPVSIRSAALPLCHLWQEEFGYISADGIRWIAQRLKLQPINILEIVTFYPMLRQAPIGKFHVKVCRTLSCCLAGSYRTFDEFKKQCKASVDEDNGHDHGPALSEDGNFTIEFVECLASCGTAPVVMVNDDLFEKIDTPAKVTDVVSKCLKNGK